MSTIKLPILNKGEYDVWAMKMEHYLAHTDYPLWEVIQKGNAPVNVSTNTHRIMKVLPPKTAEETLAREKERKVRTTLLLALPEDYLAKAQLSDASIEIKAYTQALKKVEAQLIAHQQGQLWYEEKIRFMKIDLDDKTNVLTYHKKLLAEAEKEKDDLKAKVEKWHNSSKNLGKLLNTQMSANDKFRLGYGDYRYDGILSYKNEVLQSVFMNKEGDLENQPLYDSDETHESLPEPAVNEPKVVSQPNVWFDAPIIEEYESNSKDEHVSLPTEEQETPSFANKQVKTPRETVKNQFTHSKNPKVDKKGLGYRTGKILVNTARASGTDTVNTDRHNVNRQAVPTNVANIVNTVKPIVNNAKPKSDFHKSISSFKKSLNRTTTLRTKFSYQKVNTAGVNSVSVIEQNRETVVKTSAGGNWRTERHYWNRVSILFGIRHIRAHDTAHLENLTPIDTFYSHAVHQQVPMANLKYSDKHNMVAFLKKPNESVGFTKVVDFLKGTSLRTLANGTQQLVASIDSKEYIITEASVKSKLQLADAAGIHNLSDADIYAGLATLGYVTEGITTENKGRYLAPTLTKKLFANMKRGFAGDIVPLLPAMLAGAAVDQDEGSAQPAKPHHIPVDPIPSTS
ncbi:hypothetical protein Tco_0838460 [Tanacetum coccineum]|uniref:Uncharacterized protein n=1 Tax=Tanacetum coccineum TaxID=301880 RepID=A0ABQ5ANS1_9ASTR